MRDIDYTGSGQQRHRLDLFLPARPATTPAPVIVFIHAGGWESGDKGSADILLPYLISGTHYAGASINYRLTNQAIWPAQIADCRAAILWLKSHAREYQLDSSRMAVVGISSGAHLAAKLGMNKPPTHPVVDSTVRAVVAFAGAYDFLTWDRRLSVHDPEDIEGIIPKLLGTTLSLHPQRAAAASPVFHASKQAAPFLLIHGDTDHIVSWHQTIEMHATLLAAGGQSCLIIGRGGGHYFLPQELISMMRDFLAHHLLAQGGTPPAYHEITVE